jgi:hypothetical protein
VREEESAGGVVKLVSLSHWMLRMVQTNYVDTKAKKWERVGKVSDFWRSGNVHE